MIVGMTGGGHPEISTKIQRIYFQNLAAHNSLDGKITEQKGKILFLFFSVIVWVCIIDLKVESVRILKFWGVKHNVSVTKRWSAFNRVKSFLCGWSSTWMCFPTVCSWSLDQSFELFILKCLLFQTEPAICKGINIQTSLSWLSSPPSCGCL